MRDSDGVARYDPHPAIADLALAEKLLIDRLSVTATMHRLAHGGVASTGHVATCPKPADPMAAVLPILPPEVTIVRVRRGATEGLARTQNRLYAVRQKKVLDSMQWLKGHSPY